MKRTVNIVIAAMLGVMLCGVSACSGVKKELGVGRQSPDEFMVVKRAPLTLPPDYTLRPPEEEAMSSSSVAANQAKTSVLGAAADGSSEPKGSAETFLLQKMGGGQADPEIRSRINRDNGYIALENRTVADKLIFWKDEVPADDGDVPASVVDPKAEARRIKGNQSEGKPINEGNVPVIEKKQSTIDKLF